MAVFAETCRQRNSRFFTTHSSDADGRVSGSVEYDVFGKVVTETGVFVSSSGGSGGISALVFGYAGKPYDSVTGLSDYGFRDYAPSLARFTTIDPIRDGSNWYAYCNSDPVNYVDLWGLYTQCQVDKVNDALTDGSCFANTNPLSDFIDTAKYAKVICNNLDKLDEKTQKYYQNIPEQYRKSAVQSALDNTMVYSGIKDDAKVNSTIGNLYSGLQLGGNDQNSVDGLTIGNNIYMASKLDPKSITNSYIELLGHESIHVLQGVSQGQAQFLTDYTDNYTYDVSNPYELAAYQFGGMLSGAFLQQIGTGNQILGTGQNQTNIRR